jgi:Domain of unknown function (DUF4184)
MPYTLSHVAAVVPFARPLARWRVLSAAVIGSMVPDFHYLLPFVAPRFETHSATGLLSFCLPVGMLAYWLFQYLMKGPLLSVLPTQAYRRWLPYSAPAALGSLRQWLLAAAGVLVGAVVHLAWDGFTHEDARGVRMVPELADPLVVHGHLFTGARLLQDLSSLLGLALMIAATVYALRSSGPPTAAPARALAAPERRTWVGGYVLATVLFSAAFFWLDHPHWGGPRIQLGAAAIALLRGLTAAGIGVSVLLQGYLRSRD